MASRERSPLSTRARARSFCVPRDSPASGYRDPSVAFAPARQSDSSRSCRFRAWADFKSGIADPSARSARKRNPSSAGSKRAGRYFREALRWCTTGGLRPRCRLGLSRRCSSRRSLADRFPALRAPDVFEPPTDPARGALLGEHGLDHVGLKGIAREADRLVESRLLRPAVDARAEALGADERADTLARRAVIHVRHDSLLLSGDERELLERVLPRVDALGKSAPRRGVVLETGALLRLARAPNLVVLHLLNVVTKRARGRVTRGTTTRRDRDATRDPRWWG